MIKVILDPSLRAKLHDLTHSLELCDENGQVLGYFAPVVSNGSTPFEGEVPFSDEEMKSLLEQTDGRPLADILADLEKRR